jgi:cytochrome b
VTEKKAGRLIWDWPLRLWHWLFAIAVLGAWITGQWGGYDWRQWHLWFGQSVVGLLIFRIVWGFAGTRYSRFASLLYRPGQLLTYLKSLTHRDVPESTGHSPLGAVAVIVLLTVLGIQAGTGLFMSDDILYEGPWYAAVNTQWAELASSIHHQLDWAVGALLGLHLAAILAYRLFKGQHLTRAMVTGRKSPVLVPESSSINHSRSALALILIILVAGFTWWLLAVAPPEPSAELEYW